MPASFVRFCVCFLAASLLAACGDKPTATGDQDGDGHLSLADGGDDCDDTDAAVFPGADDAWYDGVDSDCGGEDDADADADGFAWAGAGGADCDDSDAAVHPEATDPDTDGVDQDCDGLDGPDADGDGFAGTADDCDDTDPGVFPGASDPAGDGVDQDCDGTDGVDADGDGFRARTNGGLDCDDTDAGVNPDAADPDTDGVDQDCDGVDGVDADGDGAADAAGGGDDCDDTDPAVNPAAEEICGDGVDNDCDGGAGACGLEGALELDEVGIAIRSEASEGRTGKGVAAAGDVNGDGVGDLLVGAPGSGLFNTAEGGQAFLVLGPITANNDDELDLRFADAVVEAETAGDRMGIGLVSLGDLDGDGFGDIAVGAPGHNDVQNEMGAVYVFYGPMTGSLPAASADVLISTRHGTHPDRSALELGARLGAGDVDGDGVAELLVGHGGTNYSRALLLQVPATGVFEVEADYHAVMSSSETTQTGAGVAMGDLDGDGVDDIVVGAPDWQGNETPFVYIVLDEPVGEVDLAGAAVGLQGVTDTHAGSALAVAPDTDGDGLDDLVVGAPDVTFEGTGAGRAYIVPGRAVWSDGALVDAAGVWEGVAANDRAGESVAGVGDLDGDGLGEVAIGACQGVYTVCGSSGQGPGMVYLLGGGTLEGTHSLADARAVLRGTEGESAAGAAVSPAGDLNADGRPDFLIGAPDQDGPSGDDEGAAWLILTPEGL